MGYWGFEPKDGDSPHDVFFDVTQHVSRDIADIYKKLDSRPKATARTQHAYAMGLWDMAGVVQLCVEGNISLNPSITDRAINDLQHLGNTDSFIDGWKDREKIHAGIRSAIAKIKKLR